MKYPATRCSHFPQGIFSFPSCYQLLTLPLSSGFSLSLFKRPPQIALYKTRVPLIEMNAGKLTSTLSQWKATDIHGFKRMLTLGLQKGHRQSRDFSSSISRRLALHTILTSLEVGLSSTFCPPVPTCRSSFHCYPPSKQTGTNNKGKHSPIKVPLLHLVVHTC